MAKIIIVLIVVLILGGALYLLFWGSLPKGMVPFNNKQVMQPVKSFGKGIDVPLHQQNNSNQLGYAQLLKTSNNVTVKVLLKGRGTKPDQPVNIYAGSCNNLGDKKYPLKDVSKEQSSSDINVTGDNLITQLPLAVSVAKSSTDNTSVACGDVQL